MLFYINSKYVLKKKLNYSFRVDIITSWSYRFNAVFNSVLFKTITLVVVVVVVVFFSLLIFNNWTIPPYYIIVSIPRTMETEQTVLE
jgi:hypothetical protein